MRYSVTQVGLKEFQMIVPPGEINKRGIPCYCTVTETGEILLWPKPEKDLLIVLDVMTEGRRT